MRGFKCFDAAERFRQGYDEFRNFLRPRIRHNQPVPASRRRLLHLRRASAARVILEAASTQRAVHLVPSGLAQAMTELSRQRNRR
jgi:hypothetical protein